MNPVALAEGGWLPDWILRRGIRQRCGQILAEWKKNSVEIEHEEKLKYIAGLKQKPIAIKTKEANEQHYELIMGKNMKYSSCLYKPVDFFSIVDEKETKTLDEAEENMLSLYCERAEIKDGIEILDLGCGWGSFSLYASKRFPKSNFTAVSNSSTQKTFIDEEAKKRGINNLQVITADVTTFETEKRFDRIISVEMFEHMKNYDALLTKVSSWLKENGKLFVQIFAHKRFGYDYREGDWMADNFFSGGTMPSADLFLYFQQCLTVEQHWILSGTHYQKTSEDWLLNMDRPEHQKEIREIFAKVYGPARVTQWVNKWRLFWLACAELFGYNNGQEWVVVHYLFRKK